MSSSGKKINVTVWNENIHDKEERVKAIYPEGIHGAVKSALEEDDAFQVTIATLDMPEQGLSDEVLNNTDVLFWWGHVAHGKVDDALVERIWQRILGGMGFVGLHSAHYSKIFKRITGTGCRLKWRESGDTERIWVVEQGHPIANGLPEYFELAQEETYGEKFDIPAPDDLIFLSWFTGGEVCRSGFTYNRGKGKIFYFRPGHETYPIYLDENVRKVLRNAAHWAAPVNGPSPTYGKFESVNH